MRCVPGLALSMALLSSCKDGTEAERLGLYSVLATRLQNTCGSQLSGKVPSARFNVALALQQGVLHWTPAGAVAATGSFDVFQGTFRIAVESSIQAIAPDRRREVLGCVLRRVDMIEGTVSTSTSSDAGAAQEPDAGTVISGFRAQESIAYGRESGECSALLGVGQGQALTLPCVVGYQMEATRIGP